MSRALRTSMAALAVLLCLFAPAARAGAVFEIREDIPASNNDFRFNFDQTTTIAGAGSIIRSAGSGAGKFFQKSAIPLAIFKLNRCTAVAPHIHPNAGEELFVLTGKIRVHQFRGEEDGTTVRKTDVNAGQGVYIQQGAYHVVENIAPGETRFLQIFDHPFGGANFAAPALVSLPRNIVNSAFSSSVLPNGVSAKGAIIKVNGCTW